jgi:hypothetical protein
MAVIAQEISGLPRERVFSSGTVLDTSRLRWKIAQRAGVSISSVHAYIVGEHGDTEFPLWSHATIGTVPILEWQPLDGQPRFTKEELDQIAVDVRDAAYKVIQGKGATNYAIGLSGARIVEAILGDEHTVLPVAPVLEDFHGVSGVALSVPAVLSASGAQPIRDDVLALRARALPPFRRRAARSPTRCAEAARDTARARTAVSDAAVSLSAWHPSARRRPWRTAAPSAAGRARSGSAGAASASSGAPSSRRRRRRASPPRP